MTFRHRYQAKRWVERILSHRDHRPTVHLSLIDNAGGPSEAMAWEARETGEAMASLGPRGVLVMPSGCEVEMVEPPGVAGGEGPR